jgi:L-lactate dehydrogenase complex protein LldG
VTARDAILARLGGTMPAAAIDAAADALLLAPERPLVDAGALEQTFLDRLAVPSVGATVDRIASLADLPHAVAAYLDANGLPGTLCVPPDPRIAAGDWSGITLHGEAAPDENAVLAFARCGVAETGSLVFETGAHAPMLPNFLALHHLVVVPALVPHLEDAAPDGAMPRAHYWVTGVSGTTDIEGSYVRGAHGPRYLHVILMGQLSD